MCGESPQSRLADSGAPVRLPEPVLAEIVREVEAGYPDEVCGMVIGRPGVPESYQVRGVANVANREPQEDRDGVRRDARTAYLMDPREELRVLREADERGWDVLCVYHSHPDHDAYFSRMDCDRALTPEREPLWPGATYLVVSVVGGRARDAACYRWDAGRGEFAERRVALPTDATAGRGE